MSIRLAALIAALAFASAATYTGIRTQNFMEQAQHASGQVVSNADSPETTVRFPTRDGIVVQHRIKSANASPGDMLPLLYVPHPTDIDVRLDRPNVLWAPMWHWIEFSVGALLIAIYGRALVEDPLSVIGFKGARLRSRR